MKRLVFTTIACALAVPAYAASSLEVRLPTVLGPTDPVVLYLDLTSDRDQIASVGSRITYDETQLALVSVEKGAGIPASWSFVYQDSSTAGEIDVSLTDQTSAAATITGPVADLEALKVTFSRIGTNCATSAFDFNATAPAPGPQGNAFPENQYIIYVDSGTSQIVVETATTTPGSGPTVDDHGFVRGNVNNRAAHALDVGDVIDLVNWLFGGFVLSFDCEAAGDVNNDGGRNIVDVVALVQGVFGTTGFIIPPPNATDPGLGIPGVVTVDGGTIPSVLGCNQGETCP